MTETEVWKALESHYQNQNWTGVAVLADWFEEQGQAPLADTLRWLSRREAADRPVLFQYTNPKLGTLSWLRNGIHRNWNHTRAGLSFFDLAVAEVHKERTEALEDLL